LTWHLYDTWIVLTGMVAAMSCALPGVWLVLRRQSLLGDALSHTALPGIVVAFLLAQWLQTWFPPAWHTWLDQGLLAGLAVLVGVGTAILAEALQKLGRVESSAALGVVFTSLFALGLFLVRLLADRTDLDADCVLFGQLELSVLETVHLGPWELPQAALTNGIWLVVNGLIILACFKELRIAAFYP
jgi:manganese/zinc/iron transport system permease protein